MTFDKGNLITATKLNLVNADNGRFSGTHPQGYDWIQDSISHGGVFYSVRSSGSVLATFGMNCGMFGGGHITLYMLVNGSWQTLETKSGTWYTSETWYFYSQGEGWYRFYSDDLQYDAIPFTIWYGQNNCIAGHYLVEYNDTFTGDRNVTDHHTLTADLLNTGRVGTAASL